VREDPLVDEALRCEGSVRGTCVEDVRRLVILGTVCCFWDNRFTSLNCLIPYPLVPLSFLGSGMLLLMFFREALGKPS
jgi:hypothetical protein